MKISTKGQRSSKKPQAIQTSRHLHVVPRQHSGHLLPKQHTSYALLTMVLLCMGVLLTGWTRAAMAQTASGVYTVQAGVKAPLITKAATIDSPIDGAIIGTRPITVTGSCSSLSYVVLTRNDFNSGAALCGPAGTYSITTDLFRGTNKLVAHIYNFNDIAGPASQPVAVRYMPSTGSKDIFMPGTDDMNFTPELANTPDSPQPFFITSNYKLQGFYVGQAAKWDVHIRGGAAPFALYVEWGDGSHQLYSVPDTGNLRLEHIYQATGGYRGGYVIRVTGTDRTNIDTFLQLFTIVSEKQPKAPAGSSGFSIGSIGGGVFPSIDFHHFLGLSWSIYGIVLLMLFSFWLGERTELQYIRVRTRRNRHA